VSAVAGFAAFMAGMVHELEREARALRVPIRRGRLILEMPFEGCSIRAFSSWSR